MLPSSDGSTSGSVVADVVAGVDLSVVVMLSSSVVICICSVVPVLSVSKFVDVSVVGFFVNSAGKVKITSGHRTTFIGIIDNTLWM